MNDIDFEGYQGNEHADEEASSCRSCDLARHFEPLGLSVRMALRIHKAFGPDVGHLLRMQAAHEAAQISKRAGAIKVKRYVAKAA